MVNVHTVECREPDGAGNTTDPLTTIRYKERTMAAKDFTPARNWIDITRQRFTRLLVVEYLGRSKWRCRCDCGTEIVAHRSNLKSGQTGSCGCLQRELAAARLRPYRLTHGHTEGRQSPTYVAWQRMKQRCYYPGSDSYAEYGGRGIRVCDRWRESFKSFLDDMGEKPKGLYSLGRINNDGDYEPSNCRWETQIEQERNKRSTRTAFYMGKERSLAEISEMAGADYRLVYERVTYLRWPVDKAVALPPKRKKEGK